MALLPVFILNLPEEYERYDRIAGQLSRHEFISVNRVAAVRGSCLPDVASNFLTKNAYAKNYKGTLGCFLSHTRAWEMTLTQDARVSLIMEDDVRLPNIELLRDISFPKDLDVGFCNDRTAYPESGNTQLYSFRPLNSCVSFIEHHGRAVGGDGYFLSKTGAQKLLDYVQKDSFFGHVDSRIMAYALNREPLVSQDLKANGMRSVKVFLTAYPGSHRLTGYSFFPPITMHPDREPSRRMDEDELEKPTRVAETH